MAYTQGYRDVKIIPDKYNTGANESLITKEYYTTNLPFTSSEGITFKAVTGQPNSFGIDYQYANTSVANSVTIENVKFYGGISQINSGGAGKTLIFKNCTFDGGIALKRNIDISDNYVKFQFLNCTIKYATSGCNSYYYKCKIGGATGDGANPVSFVTYDSCYIRDLVYPSTTTDLHCDGVQIYGYANTICQEILFDNCRIEVPQIKYPNQASGTYVNACFFIQTEYSTTIRNITLKNSIINGGGYSLYLPQKTDTAYTMSNLLVDNVQIGVSKHYGNIYGGESSLSSAVTLNALTDTSKLYVSTVDKANNIATITASNDTAQDRILVIVSDLETKTITVPKCYTYDSYTDTDGITFDDFPFDLQYTIMASSYVVCYDSSIGIDNQIRYVQFIDDVKKEDKMAEIIKPITLDLTQYNDFVKVKLKQGENITRKLEVTITDDGDEYQIPTDSIVRIVVDKLNGEFVDNTITEIVNNKPIIEITSDMTQIAKRVPAQIVITDIITGGILKSPKFHLLVEESAINESMIVTTSKFDTLTNMLLSFHDISVYENDRRTKEAERLTAEAIRVANENARIAADAIRPVQIELTQAEYDALPQEEKDDPFKYYVITDDDGSETNALTTLITQVNQAKSAYDASVTAGSNTEVVAARKKADNTTFATVGDRMNNIDALMAQIVQVNVKNFKCTDNENTKGNGIHDDTTGIQNTIDYASINNINTVYIPDGNYLITSPLIIPSNISLKGNKNTFITCANTSVYSIIKNSDSVNGNVNIEICNIKINTSTRYSTAGDFHPRGIFSFCKVTGLHIHDNYIKTTVENQPIWTWKCNDVEINNNTLIKNTASGSGSGIWCMSSWESADILSVYKNYRIHDNFIHAEIDESIAIFVMYGYFTNIQIYNNTLESASTSNISICTQLAKDTITTTPLMQKVDIYDNNLLCGGISLWKGLAYINIHDNILDYTPFSGFSCNLIGIQTINTYAGNPNYVNLDIDKNININNNTFYNAGLSIGSIRTLEICGNTFNNMSQGIYMYNPLTITEMVMIKNNVFNSCTIGIKSSAMGQLIQDNVFNKCSSYAIFSDLVKARILGNVFNACDKCLFINTIYTIVGSVIERNQFYDSVTANIWIDVSSTGIDSNSTHLLKDNVVNAHSTTNLNLITDMTTGGLLKDKFIFVNNYIYKDNINWIVCTA